jgi:phosphatidylglycerophosphate synthase
MSATTPKNFRFLPQKLINFTLDFFNRIAYIFVTGRIHPNFLTFLGFLAGIAVGAAFYFDKLTAVPPLIVVWGALDILDGKVASRSNRKTLFGAILDSSFDRYSEFFMYIGLGRHFLSHGAAIWIVLGAFIGSSMVSYTRARAEGLGIDCEVGIMQRAERLVLILMGTTVGVIFKIYDPVMIGVLGFIALISNITAIQRILFVRNWEMRMTTPGSGSVRPSENTVPAAPPFLDRSIPEPDWSEDMRQQG